MFNMLILLQSNHSGIEIIVRTYELFGGYKLQSNHSGIEIPQGTS
ncbi:hypothetical protein SAMN05444380_11567 [Thermophagus xiamenensis]|uniref:Uncharacterized protein n=1 Tax=Thermophagus xiamenensis TaxID=385682 RepID=A0A1I2C9L0_9BACT|nr:hypothetical protein SAMN05444380_11567 [Thermophagus xiamenensis]